VSLLQSAAADELAADIAELLASGTDAEADAEAEALTSGAEALTLGVLTLAETLALTDALAS